MDPKSFGGQNICLPKICLTQNIGIHLELNENLELECGPAQPNLFSELFLTKPKLQLQLEVISVIVRFYPTTTHPTTTTHQE